MGASDHQAYLDLLRELSGCLDRLGELSEQKAQTVRQDDLLAMDEVMKQEQVLSLSLRGLEQRRVKLLAQLGLSDVPLAALPGRYPAELPVEAKHTVETLRHRYK
ncbi:MAG: flagellar protein FlgN, partial [Oscillospiraceae bacterium]|nr:flagellar protein FlgN [Oscillospiraceae bacterium]